jgi:hypothetical protein
MYLFLVPSLNSLSCDTYFHNSKIRDCFFVSNHLFCRSRHLSPDFATLKQQSSSSLRYSIVLLVTYGVISDCIETSGKLLGIDITNLEPALGLPRIIIGCYLVNPVLLIPISPNLKFIYIFISTSNSLLYCFYIPSH